MIHRHSTPSVFALLALLAAITAAAQERRESRAHALAAIMDAR